jgi:DNA-3-methyladenine glycosylase II
VVVEVESLPASPAGVMLTVFADEPLDPTETAAIERAVSRWLSLDDDMTGFLDVAADDPAMGRLIEVARGLHQVRFASLAEGAVYFTLTQRSTQWFAAARKRRIAAELGPAVMLDGTIYRSFPSLRTLSTLTDDQMVGYSGNRQRADRLRSVVEGIAALDEEWLRAAPFDEARQALLSVAGVGAFTAHALLLRVLGRPDDVPLEMAQFALAASAVYGDSPPTAGELRERYSPWVGWWAYVSRTAMDWLPDSAAATA